MVEDYDDTANQEEHEPVADTPTIGEKRQREEDEPEDHANGDAPQEDVKSEPQDHHSQNGSAYNPHEGSGVPHNATNGSVGGVAGGGNTGFDALYIGDLQWVRARLAWHRELAYS